MRRFIVSMFTVALLCLGAAGASATTVPKASAVFSGEAQALVQKATYRKWRGDRYSWRGHHHSYKGDHYRKRHWGKRHHYGRWSKRPYWKKRWHRKWSRWDRGWHRHW